MPARRDPNVQLKHVIFASYGNDSLALIQFAHEAGLDAVAVLYSDTGWAAKFWPERVGRAEAWVQSLGFDPHQTKSVGLEHLVRSRKGWPRQGIQFCTIDLKIKPAAAWLALHDPAATAVCMIGVRRAESTNRRDHPAMVAASPNHGGRRLWAPLVALSDAERDALVRRAGFDVLPHRSKECFPCINSNRADLRKLAEDEARVAHIEAIETSLGITSNGKPRTMFRPYHYMGATGIREIVRWAKADHGKFSLDDGTGDACADGFCGT